VVAQSAGNCGRSWTNLGVPLSPALVMITIKTEPVESFFQRWKKGSKLIRKIIAGPLSINIPHNIVKFADNMEIVAGTTLSRHLIKLWTKTFFSNELRTFIFKFHNNTETAASATWP
jgi:hypothetical protein